MHLGYPTHMLNFENFSQKSILSLSPSLMHRFSATKQGCNNNVLFFFFLNVYTILLYSMTFPLGISFDTITKQPLLEVACQRV